MDNNDDRNFGRNSSKRTIKISSSFVGRVIGRGGSTIKDMQSRSGARISINKDSSNSYETDVDLFGTNDQMDSAQAMIEDLVSQRNPQQQQNAY